MELPTHEALVHVPIGLALSLPWVAVGLVLFGRRASPGGWQVLLVLQGMACVAMLLAWQSVDLQVGLQQSELMRGMLEHQQKSERFAWAGLLAFLLGTLAQIFPNEAWRRGLQRGFALLLVVTALLAQDVARGQRALVVQPSRGDNSQPHTGIEDEFRL